jgi:hypothetical protein
MFAQSAFRSLIRRGVGMDDPSRSWLDEGA